LPLYRELRSGHGGDILQQRSGSSTASVRRAASGGGSAILVLAPWPTPARSSFRHHRPCENEAPVSSAHGSACRARAAASSPRACAAPWPRAAPRRRPFAVASIHHQRLTRNWPRAERRAPRCRSMLATPAWRGRSAHGRAADHAREGWAKGPPPDFRCMSTRGRLRPAGLVDGAADLRGRLGAGPAKAERPGGMAPITTSETRGSGPSIKPPAPYYLARRRRAWLSVPDTIVPSARAWPLLCGTGQSRRVGDGLRRGTYGGRSPSPRPRRSVRTVDGRDDGAGTV